jgi:hypothetical protein
MKIKFEVENRIISSDSTTYKALDRNAGKWKKSVVVIDWTSSMFEYGTQVLQWIDEHQNNQNIAGFIFFNDCDEAGIPIAVSKEQGYMVHTRNTRKEVVLEKMLESVRLGYKNTDYSENDIEALIFAQEEYPEIEEIILIADNKSKVRDMERVDQLKKPVRIVLCGKPLEIGVAIQPDYIRLAGKVKGSLHTIEDDIMNIRRIRDGKIIRIADQEFRYDFSKRNFVPLVVRSD